MRQHLDPETYQSLFIRNDVGVKVLEDLSALFYDIESYTKNDPYHTSYKEGQRSVIRYILKRLAYVAVTEEKEDEL